MNILETMKRAAEANLYLRAKLPAECKKLGLINTPRLVLGRSNKATRKGSQAAGRIFVNISVDDRAHWLNTLRHELRHEWQDIHHGEIARWCVSKPEYRDSDEFYRLCPIELDARYYAEHEGRMINGPIDYFSVEELEEFYRDGTLIERLRFVAAWYGED